MSSNHSDWLGHNRVYGRVSRKRADMQERAIKAREETRQKAEETRQRRQETEKMARERMKRGGQSVIGRIKGAVRRIFSRGKV